MRLEAKGEPQLQQDTEAPTILIVDDEEIIRELCVRALKDYRILQAENGQEALRVLTHQSPDLILLDIMMPGMDGYEAASQLKANQATSAIPIIAVTSYALSGDDVKAFDAGCDAYVSKPFSPRALLTKIREFLS